MARGQARAACLELVGIALLAEERGQPSSAESVQLLATLSTKTDEVRTPPKSPD